MKYFEKIVAQNELPVDKNYDIKPMYPIETGVIWPPKCLADVRNNCKIWIELGYYHPEDL